MFSKKIKKNKDNLLIIPSPEPEQEESYIEPAKKNTKIRPAFCKGLQYTQTQGAAHSSKPSNNNSKDPNYSFVEKEWANSNNSTKNDRVLDKFMEEKLKEFHDKINKVEKNEDKELTVIESQTAVKKENNIKEMEKLKELHKPVIDEANEQSVWITGLRQISVPLEDKIKNIEKLDNIKRTKLLTEPIMDFKKLEKGESKIDKKMAERKRKEIRNFKKKFLKQGRIYKTQQMKKQFEIYK